MDEIERLERAFRPLPERKTLADVVQPLPIPAYVFESEIIAKRPELAVRIAVVSNCWTGLEMELGETLARLLHAQPEVGLAIYEAILSVELKRTVVKKAAIAAALNETQQEVLTKLLAKAKYLYDERVKVEHGFWGLSGYDKTVLLRVRAQHALEHNLARRKHWSDPVNWFLGHSPDFPPERIEVWNEADFIALADQMTALAFLFESFRYWMDTRNDEQREQWRRRLCTLPQIQEVLCPQPPAPRSKRQSRRQSPP